MNTRYLRRSGANIIHQEQPSLAPLCERQRQPSDCHVNFSHLAAFGGAQRNKKPILERPARRSASSPRRSRRRQSKEISHFDDFRRNPGARHRAAARALTSIAAAATGTEAKTLSRAPRSPAFGPTNPIIVITIKIENHVRTEHITYVKYSANENQINFDKCYNYTVRSDDAFPSPSRRSRCVGVCATARAVHYVCLRCIG